MLPCSTPNAHVSSTPQHLLEVPEKTISTFFILHLSRKSFNTGNQYSHMYPLKHLFFVFPTLLTKSLPVPYCTVLSRSDRNRFFISSCLPLVYLSGDCLIIHSVQVSRPEQLSNACKLCNDLLSPWDFGT